MGITHHPHFPTTKKLITWSLYALIPLALLHYYLFPHPSPSPHHHSQNPVHAISSSHQAAAAAGATRTDELGLNRRRARCDYAEGRWVRDAAGPLYNGTSCGTIKDGQNCMAHGRPDTGYLHWRWKPTRCTLPRFNPVSFLRLLKGRHLAMIGDSMARNQLESLLCLLATASRPELVYRDGEENKFRRWVFREYNATVSVFWSPFLVRGVEKSAAAAAGLNHNELHLDSADARWASELDKMDAVLFSVGHWFLHPAVYYEGNAVLGCHHCPELNHTEIGFFGVFRKAIRRALREVADSQLGGSGGEKEKLVVVTTFSPAHFEGEWDKAGACPKQEPFRVGEKEMEYMDKEMRKIEAEEAAAAAAAAAARVKIEALDVTELALMRPDGHPGPYMYPHPFAEGPKERVQNDCVHWCLPGPIDAWNEILLDIIKQIWKQQLVGSPFV